MPVLLSKAQLRLMLLLAPTGAYAESYYGNGNNQIRVWREDNLVATTSRATLSKVETLGLVSTISDRWDRRRLALTREGKVRAQEEITALLKQLREQLGVEVEVVSCD